MIFGWDFDEPQRPRPSFNAKDKAHLYSLQKGKCNGCRVKFPARNMTVDHIKPFSKGGSDKPSNLQLLCNSCNSMKGNGTQAQLKKRLAAQGIIPGGSKSKTTAKAASKAKVTKKTTQTARKSTRRRTTRRSDPIDDLFSLFDG